MRRGFGKSTSIAITMALVYACAGKSISRSDGDDSGGRGGSSTTTGGNSGKAGSTVLGGKGGTTSIGGKGGTGGVGGKGGIGGKGGTTSGEGGTTSIGGKGGTGNTAGEGGIGVGGGDGCPPREVGRVFGGCTPSSVCISIQHPEVDYVTRNEPASQSDPGGDGGAAGAGAEDLENMASSRVCAGVPDGAVAFLAFDYYNPPGGAAVPGLTLIAGYNGCEGWIRADASLVDYPAPPPGSWTKQCIRVQSDELDGYAIVVVPHVRAPFPRVRNVRFVSNCECPRSMFRYTTCGNILDEPECR